MSESNLSGQPVKARARPYRADLRRLVHLSKECRQRVSPSNADPCGGDELIPIPVMDFCTGASLLPQYHDRDLAQPSPPKLTAVCVERELGRKAEHLFDAAKHPGGIVQFRIDALHERVKPLRLLAEVGDALHDDWMLTTHLCEYVLRNVDGRHKDTLEAGSDAVMRRQRPSRC